MIIGLIIQIRNLIENDNISVKYHFLDKDPCRRKEMRINKNTNIIKGGETESDNLEYFTLTITSYGELLSIIENVNEQEIHSFIESYYEPLPENTIERALLELKIGEEMYMKNWHINKGKLLAMIPEYHREIKVVRLK